MIFCPLDGMMLSCRTADTSNNLVFACSTCPYMYPIRRAVRRYAAATALTTQYVDQPSTVKSLKARDDVLGGEKEWANAPKAKATCPRCSHEEAFFKEIQVRLLVSR